MTDKYVETTRVGWGGRLRESVGGVALGGAMFLAAFPVLFWNESRSVKTAKALEEGAGAVVSVPSDAVDPVHEGRLIHVTGGAATTETLADPLLGVSAQAIRLKRSVEMYQWDQDEETETEKKLGGGEERKTTYTYKKTWAGGAIDSGDFKVPEGHGNPGKLPFDDEDWTAQRVTLGAFTLASSLVEKLSSYKKLSLPNDAAARAATALGREVKAADGGLYLGADPANPQVGDVRVRFETVEPGPVSVAARQSSGLLGPYPTKQGRSVELLYEGTQTAEAMFQMARQENALFTWILRAGGFLLMLIGLNLIFKPLSVFADVVPFIGTLVGMGTGLVAFLAAAVLSLVTIAVAWFAARPVLSVGLVGLAAVLLAVLGKARRSAGAAQSAPAQPPPAAKAP